jgi:hypothetical protein
LISSLVAAILLGNDLPSWLHSVSEEEQQFVGRRVFFVLATHFDLPVVQVFVAGAASWLAGLWRGRREAVPN